MQFLVDKGACHSLLPRLLSRTQLSLSKSANVHLVAVNGCAITNHGYETLTLSFGSAKCSWKFLVVDLKLPILGANLLSHFHLLIDEDYRRLVNTDLYSSTLLQPHSPHQHTHGFLHPPPHVVPGSFLSRTSSNSLKPNVQKEDRSLHPCAGYRSLTVQTVPDNYHSQTIADVTYLHKAKVFSTLNLLKGYYQVTMKPEDIPKTAITTPFGKYTFNYFCYGLHNAGATFQCLMEGILRDLPLCVCYVDDLLVFSSSKEEHLPSPTHHA
ncbi:uncharacterized protein [Palaemon carinicauda]|uniref:uncharacterized protein n=1 Tax=Palaemon carinicauda TaxID=392227 RepID=UPI0035B620D0